MARKNTPSSVMYRQLKSLGISNREAARLLLNTSLVFDGNTLSSRIDDSSQLTRRVVHVEPGEIPVGMFNRFELSCPQLHRRILAKLYDMHRSDELAAKALCKALRGEGSDRMLAALTACGIDGTLFRNMLVYIDHADLDSTRDRSLMLLMLFVIVGCTANPHTASVIVLDYATNIMGADYHTAQTVFSNDPASVPRTNGTFLGIVRIRDGYILKGTRMHVLDPSGTTVGLMPTAKHTVIDVDGDVSREHALIWRDELGRWLIKDLGSMNGTRMIKRDSDEVILVGDEPTEVLETDIICLGATTRFMALPIIDPDASWEDE